MTGPEAHLRQYRYSLKGSSEEAVQSSNGGEGENMMLRASQLPRVSDVGTDVFPLPCNNVWRSETEFHVVCWSSSLKGVLNRNQVFEAPSWYDTRVRMVGGRIIHNYYLTTNNGCSVGPTKMSGAR